MLRLFRCGLVVAAFSNCLVSYGQDASVRATFLGLSAGSGIAFTVASPQRIELPPRSYLAASGGSGESLALSVVVRVQRGRWFGQPELRYQNTYSGDLDFANGSNGLGIISFPTSTTKFHVEQLAFAALGGYTFDPEQRFYLLLGPALALRLGNDGNVAPSNTTSLADDIRYAVDQAPETTQWQLHGGLGWWGRHFGVEVRYCYGLTLLVRRLAFDGNTYDYRVGSNLLLLTANYHFQLKH